MPRSTPGDSRLNSFTGHAERVVYAFFEELPDEFKSHEDVSFEGFPDGFLVEGPKKLIEDYKY